MEKKLTLDDFLGQENIKNNLQVFLTAAKQKNKPLDHVLLYGPPGLGKTSLASIIASSMGGNFINLSAPSINKVSEIASILAAVKPMDIIFIDEIHRLTKNIEEILYIAMENFRLDIMVGKNNNMKPISIPLPGFTIIGATTLYGKISAPLRHRFGITFKFDYYSNNAIKKLIEKHWTHISISEEAMNLLVSISRGIPRLCLKYLRRIDDFCSIRSIKHLDKENTREIFKELGLNDLGLDTQDMKYLSIIFHKFSGGPVGVETIASFMDETIETIEETIEPYIIRSGFIKKTPKGRLLTSFAIDKIRKGQIIL